MIVQNKAILFCILQIAPYIIQILAVLILLSSICHQDQIEDWLSLYYDWNTHNAYQEKKFKYVSIMSSLLPYYVHIIFHIFERKKNELLRTNIPQQILKHFLPHLRSFITSLSLKGF